jgi:MFS family permease
MTSVAAPTLNAPRHARLVPAIVGCVIFLQSFDANSVLVALPAMARDFHRAPLDMNMVITAYLIGGTGSLPICGWAADRFGARQVLNGALLTFAAASLLCGLSESANLLFLSRVIQGAAGAALMPVGRALVLRTADRSQFISAIATLTMPVMLGPVLGPPIGGVIVTLGTWRWLFLINLPVTALALFAVQRFVPDLGHRGGAALDWRGFVLSALSLTMLTYGLSGIGDSRVEPGIVAACLCAGVAAAWGFLIHARLHPSAILDLSLFRYPTIRVVNIGALFQRLLVNAHPFLLVLLFQVTFRQSPLVSGGLLVASALGSIIGRTLFRWMVSIAGFRRFLMVNAGITAALVASCGLIDASVPLTVVFALLFVIGVLRSLQLVGLSALGYAGLPPAAIAGASTLSSIAQQLASAIAIATAVLTLRVVSAATVRPVLSAETIGLTFVVIAILSLVSIIYYVRLPAGAGDDLLNIDPEA